MSRLDFIKKNKYFNEFSDDTLDIISKIVIEKRYPKGSYLIKQDDLSNGIYLLKEGQVKLEKRVFGNQVFHLGILESSDILGDIALIDKGMRTASAIAVTDVTVYFFDEKHFQFLSVYAKKDTLHFFKSVILSMESIIKKIFMEFYDKEGIYFPFKIESNASERVHDLGSAEKFQNLSMFQSFNINELSVLLKISKKYKLNQYHLVDKFVTDKSIVIVLSGAVEIFVPSKKRRFDIIIGPGHLLNYIRSQQGELDISYVCREKVELLVIDEDFLSHYENIEMSGKLHIGILHSFALALRKLNNNQCFQISVYQEKKV